jgi:hypothetical protein
VDTDRRRQDRPRRRRGRFLGSHLCDELLQADARVICLDSSCTGLRVNVAPLANHPGFRLLSGNWSAAGRTDELIPSASEEER